MKTRSYTIRRYDVDFIIMPISALEEIRLVPPSKLNANSAQARVGKSIWDPSSL
jgi:hypothetical protein